jgi:hypothetical protein
MLDSAIADAEGDVSAAYGARFLAISAMETPPAKIVRIMGKYGYYFSIFEQYRAEDQRHKCIALTHYSSLKRPNSR